MMYRAAASALQAEPAYGDNDELRSEAELLASLGTQALGGDASRRAPILDLRPPLQEHQTRSRFCGLKPM